jgi:hypothetical protein
MIDDMWQQNWSTLHSHSIDLKFGDFTNAARDKPVRGQGAKHSGSTGGGLAAMLPHARRRVLDLRAAFLNSFKHVPHNSITSHGMKGECFFPFQSSTRVKTLA